MAIRNPTIEIEAGMRTFARPRLFASRCLGFASCRWNGLIAPDKFVARLKPYVDYVTECPEMAIGLGVPREPVRVVRKGGVDFLIQPATGRDCTAEMASFASRYMGSLGRVDGFILKIKSPSCGLKDVKVYPEWR